MANIPYDYANLDISKLGELGSLANWGTPKSAGFNMDPMAQEFGSYQANLSGVIPGSYPMNNIGIPNDGGGFFGSFLDKRGADGSMTQGWGGMALSAATGLANAYMGMKQLGIAKDTLKFNKQKHAQNYDAQKRTTNASLEDRQRGRVASNPGAYESVGSYMDKNGIR